VVKNLLKPKQDTVKKDTTKAVAPAPAQTPTEQATEVLQNKLNNLLKKKK
jgi:hypothetical protein